LYTALPDLAKFRHTGFFSKPMATKNWALTTTGAHFGNLDHFWGGLQHNWRQTRILVVVAYVSQPALIWLSREPTPPPK